VRETHFKALSNYPPEKSLILIPVFKDGQSNGSSSKASISSCCRAVLPTLAWAGNKNQNMCSLVIFIVFFKF
jgi:hypothetical protein